VGHGICPGLQHCHSAWRQRVLLIARYWGVLHPTAYQDFAILANSRYIYLQFLQSCIEFHVWLSIIKKYIQKNAACGGITLFPVLGLYCPFRL
jgi:hypothetical protein